MLGFINRNTQHYNNLYYLKTYVVLLYSCTFFHGIWLNNMVMKCIDDLQSSNC